VLVISRRAEESIVFPTVGITITVARVADKVARIAIDAPRSIPAFRDELLRSVPPGPNGESLEDVARRARHDFLGRLHVATLAVHLARRQLEMGFGAEADLTLQKALDGLASMEQELNPTPAPPPQPRQRLKALLVEDNPNESALLGSFLQMGGIDVDRASDGVEALDYLATHETPDVVLLDMGLPRCDGPTTAAAIRANQALSRVKVFVVSGRRPDEVVMPVGIDGWFTKPLNPQRILEALAVAK
jgi:CheY-like chemotaxis protein/sRNA-binding carbon storage regulator CsrA